jgi:hypothetical protein
MTMAAQRPVRAYGDLEVDICDADRLARVIHELFMAKIAEVEINVTDDEHDYMMETLLDRLRDLTGEIKRDFYRAGKTVSAGRNN